MSRGSQPTYYPEIPDPTTGQFQPANTDCQEPTVTANHPQPLPPKDPRHTHTQDALINDGIEQDGE